MANIFGILDHPAMGYSKRHTAETRERILESAAGLFRSAGYEAASIDDIMAGAGLTRGGFYLHFKSKEELFAEMSAAFESGKLVSPVEAEYGMDQLSEALAHAWRGGRNGKILLTPNGPIS